MLKCEICGKEYDTPLARAKCEIECFERVKREEEQNRKKKLAEERDTRLREINSKYEEYVQLCKKFMQDYDNDDYTLDDLLTKLFG